MSEDKEISHFHPDRYRDTHHELTDGHNTQGRGVYIHSDNHERIVFSREWTGLENTDELRDIPARKQDEDMRANAGNNSRNASLPKPERVNIEARVHPTQPIVVLCIGAAYIPLSVEATLNYAEIIINAAIECSETHGDKMPLDVAMYHDSEHERFMLEFNMPLKQIDMNRADLEMLHGQIGDLLKEKSQGETDRSTPADPLAGPDQPE